MSVLFWPILFLVIGLLLLFAEAFLPSGGFIGFVALLCVALSLWHGYQQSPRLGLIFLVVDLVVVPMTAVLAFWLWAKSPFSRQFLLTPPSSDEIEVSHAELHLNDMVGRKGRALTPLRPSGHVQIEGRRYDGMAEDGLIPAGALIRVVRVRTGQVIVEWLERPLAVDSAIESGAAEPLPFEDPMQSRSPLDSDFFAGLTRSYRPYFFV